MNKLYFLIIAILSLYLPLDSFAQQQITARIVDAQTDEPIPGAAIIFEGTAEGVVSNNQGIFILKKNDAFTMLQISFVGYETISISSTDVPSIIKLTQSVTSLNQIVVTGNRGGQERKDVPVAISTISSLVMAETKPTKLDQVLNKISGVYMADLGNEQHMMAIRQPISTKGLFLYLEDGIPIRVAGVFNHNALLEMNMAAISKIEVIRGPASSMYGSEAIGGAINFITQNPTATPNVRFGVQGNNIGYQRMDLSLSNTKGKVGAYVSGYYARSRDGIRDFSDFDKLALTAKLNYTINDNTKWSNSLTYIDYVSDMSGSLDSANYYGEEYSSVNTFTNRDVNALRFKSQLQHFWNKNSETKAIFIYRKNSIAQLPSYRIKDDYSPWGNPGGNRNLAHGESNENAFNSYSTIIQHQQNFDFLNSSVTAGFSLDYSPNTYKANYISINKTDDGIYDSYTNHADSMLTDYEVDLTNVAGYIRADISPVNRLKLIAAVRYDGFNYDYRNNLGASAFSGAPDSKDKFHAITPKLGATYDFGKNSGMYANYSIGFAPPQVGELYRGVKVPTLDPADYTNTEIGGWVSLLKNMAYIDVAVYQMNGKNEIIQVLMPDGSLENQNAGETEHKGIEYGLTIKPLRDFVFRFNGSNASHTFINYNENGNDYSDNEMAQAPSFIANSEITYKPKFITGFRISLEWQHIDGYFMDAANTKEYRGHDLLNVRVGYNLKGFEIWTNVLNATNQKYSTRASASSWGTTYSPGDPINVNIGVAYTFTGVNK